MTLYADFASAYPSMARHLTAARHFLHYDDAMALISWNRWLDRFGDAAPVGVLPSGLTFSVRQERRASLKDRRISNQPWPGQSRRSGLVSRRR